MKIKSKVLEIMSEILPETESLRNELISSVMRMEKVLRTNNCPAMRAEVKKLRELVK